MLPTSGVRSGFISRREALALLVATTAVRGASAAGILQPATLDHVNIRVSSVAKSSEFYIGLFDTPMLRNAALKAQPDSPPSEAFFFKMGDAYLVMSQAFAPDTPGLDHYSIGLRDYEQSGMAAKLRDNGIAGQSRSADIWVRDLDGSMIQLRTPGGWARQTAAPLQGRSRVALSPLSMTRIGIRSGELSRAGDFYGRLFGTEIASAASSRSRSFSIGDSTLELISVSAASAPATARGIDHIPKGQNIYRRRNYPPPG